MLRKPAPPGKTPHPNAPPLQRRLASRRAQLLAGLIPWDSRSGFSVISVCAGCAELIGLDITMASERGDILRTACEHCGESWEHQLDSEYPLAPIGSDAAPVSGGPNR